MANRVVPTPPDADNPAGSRTLAACNDWRDGVRRFHVGTGHFEPTHDAGYYDCRLSLTATTIDQSLAFRGESIYARLGRNAIRADNSGPTTIDVRGVEPNFKVA